jgi:hypothetical protein
MLKAKSLPTDPSQREYEGSVSFTHCGASQAHPATLNQNPKRTKMAEADLDILIRSIGKKQHKSLMDAAKKRHARLMGLAAKARNKGAKDRFRQIAKTTLAMANAAARRLQVTAENAADSYARAMKRAAEEIEAAEEKSAKKAVKNAIKKKG